MLYDMDAYALSMDAACMITQISVYYPHAVYISIYETVTITFSIK